MQALLWPIVTWLLRTVVLQFVVMGIVLVIVSKLMPVVLNYVSGFVSPGGLSAAFGGIDPGVWYFLDFFALDYGMPLVISAYVTRFLIRRVPFIG
jgi:hypothetical protein